MTATRSNALAAGASYPTLTVVVNVASNAPASVTNTATVAGGGERNTANDTASDATTIVSPSSAPTVSPITAGINSGMIQAGTQVLGLAFDLPVLGGGTAANYELQSAGPDGLLGTADDQIVPLTAFYQGKVATLSMPPLVEGVYRLTVYDTITNLQGVKLDGNGDGVPGGNWVRDFVVTPSSPLFAGAPPSYPIDGTDGSLFVAAGDFNNDGLSDLAVVNYYQNDVAILLANGSGGFSAATTYPTGGSEPRGIVTGDFNGDGNLDLAVVNSANSTVGILLGDGKGRFAAPMTFSTGGNDPFGIAVADFNHDGKLDLAVANIALTSSTVGILLGDGTGKFGTPTTYSTAHRCQYPLLSAISTATETSTWP